MKLFQGISSFFTKKKRRVALIIVVDKENRVLLLRRSQTDNWMPGKWGLPGGHVEPHENFAQAAVRELREETNLRTNALLPFLPEFFTQKASNKIQKYYIAPIRFVRGGVSLSKASHGYEHDGYRWVSKDILYHPNNQNDFVPGMMVLLNDFWKRYGNNGISN